MSLSRPRPSELIESLGERAEALCATPSPTGDEAELCGELETWGRALYPAVQRVKNSLVVWVDGAPGPLTPTLAPAGAGAREKSPLVALVGHIDTVPVPE